MPSETPLLEINGATLVKNGTRILDNLCLTIPEGQHTAILGPNGSGKSSLIKLLTRQHYPLARKGDGPPILRIFGRERWHVSELRSLLGIVSADLHRDFTADEALNRQGSRAVWLLCRAGAGPHTTKLPVACTSTPKRRWKPWRLPLWRRSRWPGCLPARLGAF